MELHNLKKPYRCSMKYDYITVLRVSEKVEKTQWELFNDSNKYSQQLILVSESIPDKMEYLMRTNYSPW